MIQNWTLKTVFQVIMAITEFEIAFFGITRFDSEVFQDGQLLLFNLLFVAWLGMEASRVKLGHDKVQTFGKFSRSFLMVSIVCLLLAVWDRYMNYQIINYFWSPFFIYLGMVIFVIGVYLRHLSIKTLGKYFVTKIQIIPEHELITEGIYSIVRHPSYTGLILGFLGLSIFLQSVVATFAFLVVGLPVYVYRIKLEETALRQVFGEKYEIYRSNTYMLVPFLV